MPPAVIAVGAIAASAIGSGMAANAAGKAASDQQDAARVGLAYQEAGRQQAIDFSKQDFGQMAAINSQLQWSANLMDQHIGTLQKQVDLYNQVGSQASDLLNGKSAASLAPLEQDIARQRTQLQNKLRDQMGSGWSSSSAGIEAMARFDQQANASTTNAQQTAIGQYLGYGSQINQGINQTYQTAAGINQGAVSALDNEKGMRISAANTTAVNFNPSIQTAGAGATTGAFMGGALNQAGGSLLSNSAGISSAFNGAPAPLGTSSGSTNLFESNNSAGGSYRSAAGSV